MKSIYFIILSLPLIRIFAPIIENIVNTTLVLIPVDSSSMNKTLSPLNDAIVDKEEDALKILAALRNKFMKVRDKALGLVAPFLLEELLN